MKKNFIKLYIFAVVMFTDFRMFADPGDDGDDPENPVEGDDDPPLPINSRLLYLGIAGALFAFYMYRRQKQLQEK